MPDGFARRLGLALLALALAGPARAEEGIFLREDQAPAAVFPDADRFTRLEFPATAELRDRVGERLGSTRPSMWEDQYVAFRAERGERTLGHALIVEEVGKHRPITFVVGLRPDGRIQDVAVMAYREPYGSEVRQARFLVQYQNKGPADPVRPYRDIRNIAGATLSVEAASRAVKKAQAVAAVLGLCG